MSSRAPSGIARFDSAAAMAQATGAFLRGKDVASLSGVATSDRMMPIVNRLPRRLREWVYSVGGMTEAVNATDVQAVDVDGISRWITGRFRLDRIPPPSSALRTARPCISMGIRSGTARGFAVAGQHGELALGAVAVRRS
jgi:hypothetical protein